MDLKEEKCQPQSHKVFSASASGPKLSTTPLSRKRRKSNTGGCFAPFKAPTPTRPQSIISQKEKIMLAQHVITLKEKRDLLDIEIEELQQHYSEEELEVHIEKLHEYNEIKDVGQMLLGRLAEVQQTTTRSLYEGYGLELND